MPINDAEAEFERAAQGKRRSGRILILAIAAVAIAPFAFVALRLHQRSTEADDERRAELLSSPEADALRHLLDEKGRRLAESRASWARNMTPQALDALVPGDEDCPYTQDAPTDWAATSYVQSGSIDRNYFGAMSYTLLPTGSPVGESAVLAAQQRSLTELRSALGAATATKSELSDLRRHATTLGETLIVRVEHEEQPLWLDGTFRPGRIVGTAYLYSHDRERIACMAAIDARSSSTVAFRSSYMKGNFLDEMSKKSEAAAGALKRDLEVQLRRAVALELRVAVAKQADAIAP